MIRVDKETLEPSSFEWGRVLTETTVLDRIEERLELSVNGHIFPIRISESESFLRGSRRSCSCFVQPSVSADSESDQTVRSDKQDIHVKMLQGLRHIVRSGLERSPFAPFSCSPVFDTKLDWVSVPIVGGIELKYGHVAEGSTTEVSLSNGGKRKVRLLSHIVQNVLSPQVKLQAKKYSRKGKGRPCKSVVPSSTRADISLSDSDLRSCKEAIFK
ncbi:hypothetical protein V6N13_042849 [Hibiscus sabdariffa]